MAKTRKDITYLFEAEKDKLLKVIKNPRDKAIFTVIYYCGLRATEVGMLKIVDLRLNDGRLFIHRLKGSISGDHILSPMEVRALRVWLSIRTTKKWMRKNNDILFPSNRGLPIDRVTIYKMMKKYCTRAGIAIDKAHPHILKHSIATHLLNAGEDIATVQDWLGHKDIKSTLVYAKVTTKRREEAANRFYGKD